MFKNYFKIALRNIARNKLYTAINILGLALGICSCIAIYTVVAYEFSFDTFHPDNNRIYRLMGDVTENTGDKLHFGRLPVGVSQNGRSEITGLDAIAGIIGVGDLPAGHGRAADFLCFPPPRRSGASTENH